MKSAAYIHNEKQLSEINSTLLGSKGIGKIGIFLPTGVGDIMTAMSVLKYKDYLWPQKDVVWFCNMPNADAVRFNDSISEIRPYPWEGISVDPYTQLKTHDNRLSQTRKHEFDITSDLEDGYFPAPWMVSDRDTSQYANVSKKIFGIPNNFEWHPHLGFSKEEKINANNFILDLPKRKNILLETKFHSGQSGWDDDLTKKTISICREHWGECNFIFASLNSNADSFGGISCQEFTVRQMTLINNLCDLFVGVSSGISVATSCWGSSPIPKIQFCNSIQCSTQAIANGEIHIICPDEIENNMSAEQKATSLKYRYEKQLIKTLIEHNG